MAFIWRTYNREFSVSNRFGDAAAGRGECIHGCDGSAGDVTFFISFTIFLEKMRKEAGIMFKRKIYNKMLEWKRDSDGRTALLIEGARRIGKSTVVEEFAKNEYESYILIDFAKASKEVKSLFEDKGF